MIVAIGDIVLFGQRNGPEMTLLPAMVLEFMREDRVRLCVFNLSSSPSIIPSVPHSREPLLGHWTLRVIPTEKESKQITFTEENHDNNEVAVKRCKKAKH